MVEHTVGAMESGKKLHRVIRQLLPGVPLSGIYKMLRTGRIKRNGKRGRPDDIVTAGDVLRLYMSEEDYQTVRKPEKKFGGVSDELEVVFEDESILVVSKPSGLLVHGAEGEYKDTLVNRVAARLYRRGELMDRAFTPAPANRLDRNTSGLVLFGKTNEIQRRLTEDIANHRIRKWYLAIVTGRLTRGGEVNARLNRSEQGNRTIVSDAGKEALTRYQPLVAANDTTLVRLELVSGRTHQIRAHMAHIGHPLWGDVKYAGRLVTQPRGRILANRQTDSEPAQEHQWLHAAWLKMSDGDVFTAPLPTNWRDVLSELGYRMDQVQSIIEQPPIS